MTDSNELDGSEISSMIEIDYRLPSLVKKPGRMFPSPMGPIGERKGYEFHWAP
jgi:hypothetical protein